MFVYKINEFKSSCFNCCNYFQHNRHNFCSQSGRTNSLWLASYFAEGCLYLRTACLKRDKQHWRRSNIAIVHSTLVFSAIFITMVVYLIRLCIFLAPPLAPNDLTVVRIDRLNYSLSWDLQTGTEKWVPNIVLNLPLYTFLYVCVI